MTAIRDRRNNLDEAPAEVTWDERPAFGTTRGLPWWGAILLALGLAVVGAVLDLRMQGSLGMVFQGAYLLGCVAGIFLVRRKNLFGPMVQPPLILGVTVPAIVLLSSHDLAAGMEAKALAISQPLINSFPAMAITTLLTVGTGLVRILLQRNPAAGRAKGAPRGRPAGDPSRATAGRKPATRLSTKTGGAPASRRQGIADRRAAANRSTAGTPRRDPNAGQPRREDPRGRATRDAPAGDRTGRATPERRLRRRYDE